MLYSSLIFPLLSRFTEPEAAHERALAWLSFAQSQAPGRAMLRTIGGRLPSMPVEVAGVRFANPVGIAAGFDKDVRVARGLGLLGFGHVEVGTLTPRPQPGNPRPRVFRLREDRAIINRMGFPNEGVEAVLPRLRRLYALQGHPVIGASLGKQKDTALEDAAGDYAAVMRRVYRFSDYLAVNISSPNTPGLRELQGGRFLEALCSGLVAERDALANRHKLRRPLFVKIAPDLSRAELEEVLAAITASGVDGIIAANTTVGRPRRLRGVHRGEAGGLSGAPLAASSTRLVSFIHRHTGGRLPIIAAGGVFTAADAGRKLDAGASLVQLYTGLVYEGPGIAGRLVRGLKAR